MLDCSAALWHYAVWSSWPRIHTSICKLAKSQWLCMGTMPNPLFSLLAFKWNLPLFLLYLNKNKRKLTTQNKRFYSNPALEMHIKTCWEEKTHELIFTCVYPCIRIQMMGSSRLLETLYDRGLTRPLPCGSRICFSIEVPRDKHAVWQKLPFARTHKHFKTFILLLSFFWL